MKEYINYYYNLDIENIEDNNNYYSFFYMGTSYYLVFYNRTEEELKDIIDVSRELKLKGIPVHDIIFNKFMSPISKIGDFNYILFKINGNKDETYDIIDINNLNNKLTLTNASSKLYRNNWGELWSKKIDYFEIQLSELGKEKKVILNSFSYYIGLAENAISYINRANELYKNDLYKVTLSHRRIFYPNTKLNYFNPISFIFDLDVRDVAEYIKVMFFKNEDALLELITYLKITKLSNYSYHMLYARLLYPSYYFDVYEKIMNEEEDEDVLIPIIDKAQEYEIFLKDAYAEISKYILIDRVEWILKDKKEL